MEKKAKERKEEHRVDQRVGKLWGKRAEGEQDLDDYGTELKGDLLPSERCPLLAMPPLYRFDSIGAGSAHGCPSM